jgi:hypothetical protein
MEDATERRKVQNRLAQRAYRKLYFFFFRNKYAGY